MSLSFEPLTPTSFLRRSAVVFGDRTAVIDGHCRFTYRELLTGAEHLAGVIAGLGSGRETRWRSSPPTATSCWRPTMGCRWQARCSSP
jgi:acyl-CoA synthetase (AMP-forming)/AMP-acid ligase II